ncbi:MAG: hypothetical protein LBQ01_01180 [Prevotellaceae bacterium]|jgi:hypothetical protein|nr:hypothetical protein [Prevotellaceae bacterium]
MAKKKKKVNQHALQKVQAIQHKKAFIERVKKFCALISTDEPLFDLLPPKILDTAYHYRSICIKIKVAEGAKITKRFVRIMYSHIEEEMKSKWIDIVMGDVKRSVDLVYYYQTVLPLEVVLLSEHCPFRGKEKFSAFCAEATKRYETYCEMTVNIIHRACFAYANLSTRTMYTFTFDQEWPPAGLFYQIVMLNVYLLKIRYVEINKERRPVIQTGEIVHQRGVSHLKATVVPVERLPGNNIGGIEELPVYVQQHAVNRTMQRACCVYPGSVISLINRAFTEKRKIIREGDKFFVECYYYDIKIGYFVARIIDNMFVIITFLLITHSSTPEGRKLSQLTGLKRADIEFLAIDDLKTLVNSDIIYDERISWIFIKAGCESILRMNSEVSMGDFYWLWDDTKQDTELSKLIAEYIQLGDNDEDYFENEPE